MVSIRAQASQNNQPREDEMDDFGDNASDLSLPGIGTRTFKIENNAHSYGDQKKDHERIRIQYLESNLKKT